MSILNIIDAMASISRLKKAGKGEEARKVISGVVRQSASTSKEEALKVYRETGVFKNPIRKRLDLTVESVGKETGLDTLFRTGSVPIHKILEGPAVDVLQSSPRTYGTKIHLQDLGEDYFGLWDARNRSIVLNPNVEPQILDETLSHEMQHAIQTAEDRPYKGTNEQFIANNAGIAAEFDPDLKTAIEQYEKVKDSGDPEALFEAIRSVRERTFTIYKGNPGEVEARVVSEYRPEDIPRAFTRELQLNKTPLSSSQTFNLFFKRTNQ